MSYSLKPNLKTESLPIFLLIIVFVFSFYFYQRFPAQVAVHWDTAGQPNSYANKFFAAFFFPFLNLVLYLLMLLIPTLDPRKENYRYFQSAYHLIKDSIIFFLCLIYLIAGFKNLGYYLPVQVIVPFLVGLLFILIGYSLRHIKPNYFFGIRTPWTLHSPVVWQRTHNFGYKIFIGGGLLMCLLAVLSVSLAYFISLVSVVVITVIVYSYFIYAKKRLK